MKIRRLEIAQNIGRIKMLQKIINVNLLLSIYHLGLTNGFRYWKLNRYYSKHPDELEGFIKTMFHMAVLEPHEPWLDFAKHCQKSLDKHKLTKKK